jgi:hypothetical protein
LKHKKERSGRGSSIKGKERRNEKKKERTNRREMNGRKKDNFL